MIEPQTPQEWQEAIDTAEVLVRLDAARQYGLVTGGPAVNVSRCEELLRRGEALGYTPTADAVERIIPALVSFAWRCRVCGCTNERACPGGCHWVEPNLCSECAMKDNRRPLTCAGSVQRAHSQ